MIKKGGIGCGAILLLFVILGLAGACGPEPPAAIASTTPTQTLPSPSPSPTPVPSLSVSSEHTRADEQVVEVVDGDTLKISINGGPTQTVRIIGIDTPETKDPRKPVMCFGMEASAKTQELVERAGGHVQLEKDVSETDKYDRLLRCVWLLHPDGKRMLNEELVKGGYATVSTYPPDVKYQDQFLSA